MMNWYKKAQFTKKASVTFFIGDEGARKIAQPKDILELSMELGYFAHNFELGDNFMGHRDVSPDGMDYNKFEGTINFYYPDGKEMETLDIIQMWIHNKTEEGYSLRARKDMSKMTGKEIFRIDVLKNPSEELERMPEVNVSQHNARAIAKLLGLPSFDGGTATVEELMQRINDASSQESMESIVEEPQVHYNDEGNVQMYQGGRDLEYVDRRLQGLYELADWAKTNGFKTISWG